jgi:hypothetical protein
VWASVSRDSKPRELSDMRDRSSFQKRNGEDMSSSLALEMQALVREAAQPVPSGKNVKWQVRQAWDNLGRPPQWRVRAAWYGEAGCWVGRAIEDFRARHAAWKAKQEAKADAAIETAIARFAAIREALAASDPEFHGPEIDRLGRLIGELREQASKRGLNGAHPARGAL